MNVLKSIPLCSIKNELKSKMEKHRKSILNIIGFTLLELIIAITIFSISAIAIYTSFNVGIHAWRKADDSYKLRQQARHAFNAIARDLRSSLSFTLKGPDDLLMDSFEGSLNKVSFWRSVRAQDSKSKVISKITYIVEEDKKADLNNEKGTKSLYRILQSYEEFIGGEEGIKSLLVAGVSDLKIEYAYLANEKIEWGEEWKKQGSKIPFEVRVSLSFPSLNEDEVVEFSEKIIIQTGSLVEKKVT